MENVTKQTMRVDTENFICPSCGSVLKHDIKKDKFLCMSCGYESEIQITGEIQECDFSGYAERESKSVPFEGLAIAECQNCGTEITFGETQTATTCPMCGSTQISQAMQRKGIPPEGIIPFKIDKQEAGEKFRQWVKKLWFAPNKLKNSFQEGKLTGKFIPFWTYDADVIATYTGEGGMRRTIRDKDGKTQTVTDWFPTVGTVTSSFDDILVCAGKEESSSIINGVLPYNTKTNLKPYAQEYLSGYQAEVYSLKADTGFEQAKQKIESEIEQLAESDIRKRFDSARSVRIDPTYTRITYKHVLLPLWSSVFGYSGKTYRCVINGETGDVSGGRPYSAAKISIAVAVVLAVIIGAFFLFSSGSEVEASYDAHEAHEAHEVCEVYEDFGALPQTSITLGLCPKPRLRWGFAPNPDYVGALPQTPVKGLVP